MSKDLPLLIVDLQPCFNPSKDLVEKIRMKAKSAPTVIQTRFVEGNKLFQTVLNYSPNNQSLDVCIKDMGMILTKTGYGLDKKELDLLKDLIDPFDSVEVCGMEIDSCILAICFQVWDIGIQPIPLPELCGGVENRLEAQSILLRSFGVPPTRPRH
jgi:hypothetical protein